MQVDEHVQQNYREIHEQSGRTWDEMAADMDTNDPGLAAWMRKQGAAERREERSSAPRRRRAPAPAATVEGP